MGGISSGETREANTFLNFWWNFSLEDPAGGLIRCDFGNQISPEAVPGWLQVHFDTEAVCSHSNDPPAATDTMT